MEIVRLIRIAKRLATEPKSIFTYARAAFEIFYRNFAAGTLVFTEGNKDSAALILYAPGQTEPAYSSFNAGIAKYLVKSGFQVKRFDFKPIINKSRPNLDDSAIDLFCSQLINLANKESKSWGKPIILMGKSFGGAIASKVLENTCAVGCIAIGYPFFSPLTKWNRINHLPGIQKKLIIIQGSEDSQGGRDEIEEASLSSSTEIKWIQNADHGFKTNSSPEQDEIKYNELLQACSDACNTIISNCDHRQCAIGFKSGINE